MKTKYILASISILILTACNSTVNVNQNTEGKTKQTPEETYLEELQKLQEEGITLVPLPNTEESEKEAKISDETYQKWAYSGNDYFDADLSDNCIGLVFGDTKTYGDLLSSLIMPNEKVLETLEKNIELPTNYQDKNYLKILEYQVARHFQDENISNTFYTYSACNLGDEIDLLQSSTKPSSIINEPTGGDHYTTIIIRKGSKIVVHSGMRTINRTATGAEVYPCTAKIEDQTIVHKCFTRLTPNKETQAEYLINKFNLEGDFISEETINE